MSSLNTGNSVDSAEFFGSSLAAIGAASNVHKKFLEGGSSKNDVIYPIPSGDQEDDSHSDGYVVCVCICFMRPLVDDYCMNFGSHISLHFFIFF
jgi:hypothetical protein